MLVPVIASIAVVPGNAAELAIALTMVDADEKISINPALRAKVLIGDSWGHMEALMHVASRLAVALIHVVPGVAALTTAAAAAATPRWMATLMV